MNEPLHYYVLAVRQLLTPLIERQGAAHGDRDTVHTWDSTSRSYRTGLRNWYRLQHNGVERTPEPDRRFIQA